MQPKHKFFVSIVGDRVNANAVTTSYALFTIIITAYDNDHAFGIATRAFYKEHPGFNLFLHKTTKL